jgi:hypothetical protein
VRHLCCLHVTQLNAAWLIGLFKGTEKRMIFTSRRGVLNIVTAVLDHMGVSCFQTLVGASLESAVSLQQSRKKSRSNNVKHTPMMMTALRTARAFHALDLTSDCRLATSSAGMNCAFTRLAGTCVE